MAEISPDLTRRKFLQVAPLALAAFSLSGDDTRLDSEQLKQKIKLQNVTLKGEFTQAELADIANVLDSYKKVLSDIRPYGFCINRRSSPSAEQVNAESTPGSYSYQPCPEFRGFGGIRGNMDPQTFEVYIAPKNVLDALADFEQKHNKVIAGEEGRRHDFKWTLTHELAHTLAYKTGVAQGFRLRPLSGTEKFHADWQSLHADIKANAKGLDYVNGEWEQRRPQGYPTYYSNFLNQNELFADLAAYRLLDYHYADNDPYLMKRIKLLDSFFESQPKVIK